MRLDQDIKIVQRGDLQWCVRGKILFCWELGWDSRDPDLNPIDTISISTLITICITYEERTGRYLR